MEPVQPDDSQVSSAKSVLGPSDSDKSASPSWERGLIEKLASEALAEQRRKRRWGIFFKLVGLTYFGILIYSFFGSFSGETEAIDRHVGLVDLRGTIAPDSEASAEKVNRGLKAAFSSSQSVAVILRINSPGGSPVQAGLINDEITRLRTKYPEKPLYAVVEDVCASGGYYVAVAADKIFVNKASLVGSIGVLMNGFGFVDTLDKVGVERRLITAGDNKGFLDPFSATNPEQVEYAKTMIGEIHEQFIAVVREGRGERLKETPDLFSGLIWNGAKSLEIGLADELGSVGSVARDVVKVDQVFDYTEEEPVLEKLAKQVGAQFGFSLYESILGGGLPLR